MSDSKPGGLWSNLSITRGSKSPRTSEPLAHPLLGSSTSSLNLSIPNPESSGSESNQHGSASTSPVNPVSLSPKASATWSRTGAQELLHNQNLPYKPRQRHVHQNSTGSVASIPNTNSHAHGATASTTMPSPGVIAPAAAPTTSTSTTFALPPSALDSSSSEYGSNTAGPSNASATSRLQLQSLKASAQRLGLGNGSMGMGMIDAICEKGAISRSGAKQGEGGEWGDLLRVLVTGKAVLLLPSSPASTLPMTSQTLKDHIAFLSLPIPLDFASTSATKRHDVFQKGKEPASESVVQVVTLSGLVGTLQQNVITFESMLESKSQLLGALRDPAMRASSLASLRPTTLSSTSQFPTASLSPDSIALAFPALGRGGTPVSDSKDKDRAVSGRLGRMNPFASLFGSGNTATEAGFRTPDRPLSPVESSPTTKSQARASSPRPSLLSVDIQDTASIASESSNRDRDEGFNVTAYTVAKPIRLSEIHKSLSKAVRQQITAELPKLPEKVMEKIIKLVLPAICPSSGSAQELLKQAISDDSNGPDWSNPTLAGEHLQDFMESTYDELLQHYRSDSSLLLANGGLKRKGSGTKPWSRASLGGKAAETDDAGSQAEKEERRQQREELCEKYATEGAEAVEAVITRLLYNRLFRPLESDDSRHDEALASRIAALNMLDLSLDHLGLITRPDDEAVPGTISSGLSDIIDQIGQELQRLSTPQCLTPKQKADILIKAHKLVVDGLEKLPPVQLRPEGEPYQAPVIQNATEDATTSAPASPEEPLSPPQPRSPGKEAQQLQPKAQVDADECELLEEAMSESVLTIHGQPPSPEKNVSPSKSIGTSGADLILPIIIFAVVKANPPQLASQLMYLRRYRSAICLTGEASYAMVNLTAVVEFLEHVDLAELGLGGESDKVMSIADLSPIGLHYFDESSADAQSIASASSRLRGRVFQVGEMAGNAAGSANKVITGVIDSSWSAVRGLINVTAPTDGAGEDASNQEDGGGDANNRPTIRPRHASSFSLANVTASVASIAAAAAASTAAARSRANSRAVQPDQPQHTWQGNQEMIDVSSRPQSIREKEEYPSDSKSDSDDEPDTAIEDEGKNMDKYSKGLSDARSIKSVSSMMSKEGRREEARMERVSLSDRLANIGGFAKGGPGGTIGTGVVSSSGQPSIATASGNQSPRPSSPDKPGDGKTAGFLASLASTRSFSASGQGHARRSSLLGGATDSITRRFRSDSNPSPFHPASPTLPTSVQPIQPPMQRFMTCESSAVAEDFGADHPGDLGDIRLSEIGELLRDYRRLGGFVNAVHAAQETSQGNDLQQTMSNIT